MPFLILFQPVPCSPPHCPFQVGASAPPAHTLPPTNSDAHTDPQRVMAHQPSTTLAAPKQMALVCPLDREGEK